MADIYYPLLLNSPEDSEEDDVEVRVHHIPKRYIRDALNPLEFYRDVEFKRRYRFSKDAVLHGILPLIQNALAKNNNRGLPVQPVMQLMPRSNEAVAENRRLFRALGVREDK
ncbi:unnamed protein product [Tenebrio molitor]|nr:unnamed protein product [Tenebrio molitor]